MPQAPSGFDTVPSLPWGSHITHFFKTGEDLRDMLVPYFKAGLDNNERCLWVTGSEFDAQQARAAMQDALPDFDARETAGQIDIQDAHRFYAPGQKLQPHTLIEGLIKAEQNALSAGYTGLRTSGNCAWVDRAQWKDFEVYESLVQQTVRSRRMICMCNYSTNQGCDLIAVMDKHDFAVSSRRRPTCEAV